MIYGVHHANHEDLHASHDDLHAFHAGPTSHGDALLHVVPQLDANDALYHREDPHRMEHQKLVHNGHQALELRGNAQLVHQSARLYVMAHHMQAQTKFIHHYR